MFCVHSKLPISSSETRFRQSLQGDCTRFIVSNFSISGVDSVRAYKAEERFKALFEALIDVNHRCYILFVHGSRWLGVRLDLLAALCVTVAATCVLVLRNHLAPGIAGVVLVQSLQLTGLFQVSFWKYGLSVPSNRHGFGATIHGGVWMNSSILFNKIGTFSNL